MLPDPAALLRKVSASCNAVDRVEVAGEDTEIISLKAPTCLDLVLQHAVVPSQP